MPIEPEVRSLSPAACRTWLLVCPRTKEAVVVDPLLEDVGRTLEATAREGLRIAWVLDTHTHADHLTGGEALARAAGAPYGLHASTQSPHVSERLRDGQSLAAGDLRIDVLHTPGHTEDSVTLRCGRALLTGDFLFLGQDGAGRLDLPGGDPGMHWDSLRKLASLGDDAEVLPGHDYEGLGTSPLGEERRRNPRFQDVTRDEYVLWQKALAAPTPDWMLAVLAANLGRGDPHHAHAAIAATGAAIGAGDEGGAACVSGGACLASPMARVPTIDVAEAARRMGVAADARPFLLDVREPFEYAGPFGRHAPGAVLVPLATLPHRLPALPDDPAREVIVICKSGGRSARAAEFLIETGRRRVFNVAGGTDAWAAAGLPVER